MISDRGIVMKFVVLVLLLCVFASGDVEVLRCMEREREALLSFKSGLIDDYDILSSWQGDECCKWNGVGCSNTSGHVISLRIVADDAYGALSGKVSSSLLELHLLMYLDLSGHDFDGHPIPKFLFSMKQLQHLHLQGSNFYGVVPPEIGNLTNLRSLDLSYNSLTTENLDWLSSLSLLSVLDLSLFDLSHTNWLQPILTLHSLQDLELQSCNIMEIRPSSGYFVNSSSFTSLSIIGLSDNHFTPSVFDWLSNLSTSLVEINLSHNALGDLIPNAFERLSLVEYVDLSSNMIGGQIPKSLVNLTNLRVLVLFDNHLNENLDELFRNVSAKGLLAPLEILDLEGNQLQGSVPNLGAFPALIELYLGNNRFTGSVPLSLGQVTKLEVLDLSGNHLKDTVSESHLISFKSLKVLGLSWNSLILRIAPDWTPPFQLELILLSGCFVGPAFPRWIRSQRNVYVLDLSGAGIMDEAPKWLWNLFPSLIFLVLSHNQISGVLPDLSSSSIQIIDLRSNNISGRVPLFSPNTKILQLSHNMLFGPISSLCHVFFGFLNFLDLSNNQLSGELPNCWDKMPYLTFLNLANNSFLGEIPHSLGSLYDLGALQLRGNNLSGELPSSLKFCQYVNLIDVGGNNLTGHFPAWIGESYTFLTYLSFGGNRFYGSIPSNICNLTSIRILDISRNNLTGKIPNCLDNFTSLIEKNTEKSVIFGMRYNYGYNRQLPNHFSRDFNEFSIVQWKGQELEYRRTLIFLKLIDFSSNGLTGNIPQSFANMKGLISLNLSRNNLMGNIIQDIGQMEMLECLDLSNNQLSGEIPKSLANMNFLDVLDLSNNNLWGEIPSSTQLQSFDISSYAGNNGLCGKPLALCPQDRLRPPPTTQGKRDENDGLWRLSFMQGFIISMAFGAIIGFWGVVGSLVLKKSWRYAYFKLLDDTGDWFYVKIAIFISKWRR